jgi:hypothetical protein
MKDRRQRQRRQDRGQPDPRDVVVAHPLGHLEHGGRIVRQAEHAGRLPHHPGHQHADPQKDDQLRLDRPTALERRERPGRRKEKLDPEPDIQRNVLGGGRENVHGPESCIPPPLSRRSKAPAPRAGCAGVAGTDSHGPMDPPNMRLTGNGERILATTVATLVAGGQRRSGSAAPHGRFLANIPISM